MHPAFSIILFTTLSGMGFGLIFWLGLALVPARAELAAATTGLLLAVVGLLTSTFHLGRPERAWRALSQWQSSWLSREGILAIATVALVMVDFALRLVFDRALWPLGLIAAVLAGATVFATGMIYAQLRAVPTWAHPLTPACFLGFAAAGGALWVAFLAEALGASSDFFTLAATAALTLAFLLKALWWQRAAKVGYAGSTPESATGLGALGRVRLFAPPHGTPNYLMHEMVFRIGRRHARALRRLAWGLGALLPLAALVSSWALGGQLLVLGLALLFHFLGLLAERWLFFAEARHTVQLYYLTGKETAPA